MKDQALKLVEWINLMGTTELEEKAATMILQLLEELDRNISFSQREER